MKKNSTKIPNNLEVNSADLLLDAIDHNDTNMFLAFYNGKANLNCVDANNVSPLNLAAYNGNATMVALICMKNHPHPVTIKDFLGNNALHCVFHTDLFEYSKKSNYREAADIVSTLLNVGLDPFERNQDDKTALDLLKANKEIDAATKEKLRKIFDKNLLKTSSTQSKSSLPPIVNPPSAVVSKPSKKPEKTPTRFGTLPSISENGRS